MALNVQSIPVLPMPNTFLVQTALTPTFFFLAAAGERMVVAARRFIREQPTRKLAKNQAGRSIHEGKLNMAETKQLVFTYKEVVEALLKQSDIHEGLWSLYVEFGIAAMNAGPSEEGLKPAAIVPIMSLGITKADKLNNLTVDASVVNPSRAPKRAAKRKAT